MNPRPVRDPAQWKLNQSAPALVHGEEVLRALLMLPMLVDHVHVNVAAAAERGWLEALACAFWSVVLGGGCEETLGGAFEARRRGNACTGSLV
jgi:hypothetical protein